MPPPNGLSLHCKLTRWIVLQKARRHRINRLRLLVGTEFQDLFHSPPGVLFTFPSRYLFTIDHKICLALAGGPAGFRQGFSCPALLELNCVITDAAPIFDDRNKHKVSFAFAYLAITVFGQSFQTILLAKPISYLTER